MASGYKAPREGMAGVLAKFAALERQMAAMRQALRLESAVIGSGGITVRDNGLVTFLDEDADTTMVLGGGFLDMIDPATGGAMRFRRGRIYLWDNYELNTDRPGQIMVDQGAGKNYMRLFPPFLSGTGLENSFTMRGKTPDQSGMVWVFTDGEIALSAARVGLYGLPAVSGPDYQLGYDFDGTDWSMCLITSSQKYKTPLEPLAAEDVASLLDVEVGTFRMLEDVERRGDDAKVRFGAIAEQVEEVGLGDLLVSHLDGEPEALKDNLVGWALVPLVREQRDRIAELEQTVEDQARAIAALTDRLEALEARA